MFSLLTISDSFHVIPQRFILLASRTARTAFISQFLKVTCRNGTKKPKKCFISTFTTKNVREEESHNLSNNFF